MCPFLIHLASLTISGRGTVVLLKLMATPGGRGRASLTLPCGPVPHHGGRPIVVSQEFLLNKEHEKRREVKYFTWGLRALALQPGLVLCVLQVVVRVTLMAPVQEDGRFKP